MEKIFFIIILIILIILLLKSYKKKEYFSNHNTIQNYHNFITVKKNNTLKKIMTYMKYMYNEIGKSDNFRINDIATYF